jgi:hypothetical protein
VVVCLAACSLLWACTATAPQAPVAQQALPGQPQDAGDLSAQYARLAASGGRVMRLQPAASQIRILVFRAGRAARLGHNHVLTAPGFEGFFYWPEQGPATARFDLVFRLDQLEFDAPAQRAALGPAFATPLSDEAIAGTRAHMLGAENMQADRHPRVSIQALEISGEAPRFAARVAITLHGQTRELLVPLTVSGLPQRVSASGALVLRQSDFGVRPYSVMGGLLAVQDEVLLEFTLVGE